jgi:glycosyltransferase involved in cell wall biosynthesis
VDDGPTDDSFQVLKQLKQTNSHLRVIRFSRNFGQHAALAAGFEYASGEAVVTVDADQQNPPEEIPKLLDKFYQGYDVVAGWRENRKDSILRKIPSYLLNRYISHLTGVKLHDYGCDIRVYSKELLNQYQKYGEMRKFSSALTAILGKNICEVKVGHEPRRAGKSHYSFSKLVRLNLDLVTSFSTKPFQTVALWGISATAAGILSGIVYVFYRFALGNWIPPQILLLILILIFGGVLFAILGLLGEFAVRTYHLVQNRPFYVIEKIEE